MDMNGRDAAFLHLTAFRDRVADDLAEAAAESNALFAAWCGQGDDDGDVFRSLDTALCSVHAAMAAASLADEVTPLPAPTTSDRPPSPFAALSPQTPEEPPARRVLLAPLLTPPASPGPSHVAGLDDSIECLVRKRTFSITSDAQRRTWRPGTPKTSPSANASFGSPPPSARKEAAPQQADHWALSGDVVSPSFFRPVAATPTCRTPEVSAQRPRHVSQEWRHTAPVLPNPLSPAASERFISEGGLQEDFLPPALVSDVHTWLARTEEPAAASHTSARPRRSISAESDKHVSVTSPSPSPFAVPEPHPDGQASDHLDRDPSQARTEERTAESGLVSTPVRRKAPARPAKAASRPAPKGSKRPQAAKSSPPPWRLSHAHVDAIVTAMAQDAQPQRAARPTAARSQSQRSTASVPVVTRETEEVVSWRRGIDCALRRVSLAPKTSPDFRFK